MQTRFLKITFLSCEFNAVREVDYFLVLGAVKRDRLLILCICIFFSLAAYSLSLLMPNQYRSTAVMAPSQIDNQGSLGSLSSQYGGLAAIAGLSIGRSSDKTEHAIALVMSWPFIERFIRKNKIEADVYAGIKIDPDSSNLIYDDSLYDEKSNAWKLSAFKETGGKPSGWMLYKKFSKFLSLTNDKKTGLIHLSVSFVDPVRAKQWCELLVIELNEYFQQMDKADAGKNIEYLQRKISDTSVAEMKSVLYEMIESQTKVLMLAERSNEYLFKTIIPPMVPEQKISPVRPVAAAIGFVVGFFVWGVLALYKFFKVSDIKVV